ncbi:MAG: cation diffusion facilitator family transporter [Syntrophaceae bacterium]
MDTAKNHTDALMRGRKVALAATLAILFLAVIKLVTGYLFDSRILIVDAFHSGVDVLAIFASWFGLWLASRKKSNRFPYGLYKAETFVTLVIGVFITWAGIENLIEGYVKFFLVAPPNNFPLLPVLVSAVSLVAAYFIARKEKEIGTAINSQALLVNATESFLDIGTSLAVIIGILLTYAKVPYVEGSVIILIALLIIKLGTKNVWSSVLVLMDASLDPVLQKEMEEMVHKVKGVKDVYAIRIRQSGPFKLVECEMATHPSIPVYQAHDLADRIENLIKDSYKQIDSVFVHVEPLKNDVLSAIVPVEEVNGLNSRVHGHFGRAPYFIILRLDGENVEIEDFYYNEFIKEKDRIHLAIEVIKAVIKHNLDIVFTSKIGEIAFYMLKDNFVDIYKAEEGSTVRQVIEKYRNNQVDKIAAPHPAQESEVWKK